MTGESATESSDKPAAPRTMADRVLHEIRETVLTIAVFVPFWLVFSTFIYELRSIPSESMVPALQVGDRVAVSKFVYGYNRNSVPFGLGKLVLGDNADDPRNSAWVRMPKRGDVAVFQHPRNSRVMIKRVIGLPGDLVQMRDGRLYINEQEVTREEVRKVTYVQNDNGRMQVNVTEYKEQLPGEDKPHIIHEMKDDGDLDQTPIFRVPDGHLFMMGDNRDNSLDSRAWLGHLEMARAFPEAWANDPPFSVQQGYVPKPRDQAIGFVPLDHMIGRADTVLFTLHRCHKAPGAECLKSRIWGGL